MFLPLFKLHLLNKVMRIRQARRLHHIGRELIATRLKSGAVNEQVLHFLPCSHFKPIVGKVI